MINSFVLTIVKNYYHGDIPLNIELVQTFILKDFDEKDMSAHGVSHVSWFSYALSKQVSPNFM